MVGQQCAQLVLEADRFVMFSLPPNVTLNGWKLAFAEGKYSVSDLPRKGGNALLHPWRRMALKVSDKIRDGYRAVELCEDVHMVGNSSDAERLALEAAGDAAKVAV